MSCINQDIKNLYYLVDYEENLQKCYLTSIALSKIEGGDTTLVEQQLAKTRKRLTMYTKQLSQLLEPQ